MTGHFDYSAHCNCPDCRSYDKQEWLDVLKVIGAVVMGVIIAWVLGG